MKLIELLASKLPRLKLQVSNNVASINRCHNYYDFCNSEDFKQQFNKKYDGVVIGDTTVSAYDIIKHHDEVHEEIKLELFAKEFSRKQPFCKDPHFINELEVFSRTIQDIKDHYDMAEELLNLTGSKKIFALHKAECEDLARKYSRCLDNAEQTYRNFEFAGNKTC